MDTGLITKKSLSPAENWEALRNLELIIEGLRVWLPIQNPLPSFVHNNPLLNWEHMPFHEAVVRAAHLYGARPYLEEKEYRDLAQQGLIDVNLFNDSFINDDLRPDSDSDPDKDRPQNFRLKELWEHQFGEIPSRMLHDFVIPLISTFLDQGVGLWTNPFASEGLWAYFLATLKNWPSLFRLSHDWKGEILLRHPQLFQDSPLLIIQKELLSLPYSPSLWSSYLLELLFELKGWSGMVNKLETEKDKAPLECSSIKLIEWLAILLVSEHSLNAFLAKKNRVQLKFLFNQLKILSPFYDRHEKWQNSLESTWRQQKIKELQEFWEKRPLSPPSQGQPQFQVVFCIDDREESLRRHLEEVFPEVQTFGVAGFFNLDMWFLGLDRPKPLAQCPPVIRPSHFVKEGLKEKRPLLKNFFDLDKSKWTRRWGQWTLNSFYHSRTLIRGFLLSLLYGLLSYFPLFFKILFPQFFHSLKIFLQKTFFPHPPTQLILDGKGGYYPQEMARAVLLLLQNMGTLDPSVLGRWIFITAHGSTNTNNPFRQAYGCGACGGNPGHPNSRALAEMANRQDVRDILLQWGVNLPPSTVFIAAYHDTCSDDIQYWFPESLTLKDHQTIAPLLHAFQEASVRNAVERCQSFASFHHQNHPKACVQHVRERSRDLAQPRPEYGHSGIALCVVGRRELTRGFNFQRRSFLASYDPSVDEKGDILKDVLLGVLPVGVNISLDYYFSRIDPEGFGAGSKLPLNITGTLGVMTGSKSDLRIGLAQQMTEIHLPLRLTTLVEAQEELLMNLFQNQPRLKKLLENEWFFLGRIDPKTRDIYFWNKSAGWVKA